MTAPRVIERFTYRGLDGLDYVALHEPFREHPFRLERVTLSRADGQPFCLARRYYPAGYVAAHGAARCAETLDALRPYIIPENPQ